MTFELPVRDDTATKLRELEESAPNPVPKAIRAVMIQAAQELEAWSHMAEDCARIIEECVNVRYSQMATTSSVEEQQRGIRNSLNEVARRLRELA